MLDSTYTVASNPNTMRDTGPLRNAQYTVTDPADKEYMMKSASGAKKNIAEENAIKRAQTTRCAHKRPSTPGKTHQSGVFAFASSTINNTPAKRKVNIVENVTLVASNDYTKNISELVFSPSVYVRPQTTISGQIIPQ